MEELYKYETSEFGLSSDAIHLLRSRFSYKTLKISEIDSIEIKRGKDHKNWLLVLSFGLGLFLFSIYYIVALISVFNNVNTKVIYVEQILLPLFPFLLGTYTTIISLRNTTIMKVDIQNKTYYFSLRGLIKNKSYNDFILDIKLLHPTIKVHEYYS
jgi:hypothetical protein